MIHALSVFPVDACSAVRSAVSYCWDRLACRRRAPRHLGRRQRSSSPYLEALEDWTLLSTFTVLNTADNGAGSLRQAILDANSTPGLDTISFQINTGAQTIHVGSGGFGPLPALIDPVIVDGSMQPGFKGQPLIELDGTNAGVGANGLADGLDVAADGCTVTGLVINRFQGDGIALFSSNNIIQGNYIGTDANGIHSLGNGMSGILVHASSSNLIGGPDPGQGNVISANGLAGVLIRVGSGNSIAGNLIGTDAGANGILPNGRVGVGIYQDADHNLVGETADPGGTVRPAGNVIAGNNGPGVWVASGSNVVAYNTIRGNQGAGVAVSSLLRSRGTVPQPGALPGDLAPDFTLEDLCAAWCGPCQQLTQQIPQVIQTLDSLNIPFQYVQVLVQNNFVKPATLRDAQLWANKFALSSPVLTGPQAESLLQYWGGDAFPTLVLLNPDRTSFDEHVGFEPVGDIASLVSSQVEATFSDPDNVGNSILANSISDNGGLGIDLNNDGVTPNNPSSQSSGPNLLQAYPVLTSVSSTVGDTIISGTLQSRARPIRLWRGTDLSRLGSGDHGRERQRNLLSYAAGCRCERAAPERDGLGSGR